MEYRAPVAGRTSWQMGRQYDSPTPSPLSTAISISFPEKKTYFWVSMEHLPADARAAPSASVPNDTVMDHLESPKRPREASQGNMVSQRATSSASVLPESQIVTTDLLPTEHLPEPARALHITPPLWVGVVRL